jgi:small subunit ribosomal protein S14
MMVNEKKPAAAAGVNKKALDRQRGKGIRMCGKCGTTKGLIRKYGLYVCRRCFREMGTDLGFHKFN